MGDALCKIWRAIAGVLGQIVSFSAESLKLIGGAAVDVLGELIEDVGDTVGGIFGISSSTSLILLLGVGAYFLFGRSDKERSDGNLTS